MHLPGFGGSNNFLEAFQIGHGVLTRTVGLHGFIGSGYLFGFVDGFLERCEPNVIVMKTRADFQGRVNQPVAQLRRRRISFLHLLSWQLA
jgi:hypothetical protein